jgi:SAM-dependent methyltransferase
MHLNTELLFRKYALSYFKDGMKILEIGGSGITNFCKIVNNPTITWHTLDIDLAKTEPVIENDHIISMNEYSYPVDNETYDIVLSGNVIEHVKKIWKWSKELHRILKKNGILITVNPVSWPFHEAPVDCWRIYPEGAKALFEDAGFSILHSSFECLELEYFNYSNSYLYIPGFSVANSSFANFTTNNIQIDSKDYRVSKSNKIRIFFNRIIINFPIIRRMMVPVNVSFDTITVGQKKYPCQF